VPVDPALRGMGGGGLKGPGDGRKFGLGRIFFNEGERNSLEEGGEVGHFKGEIQEDRVFSSKNSGRGGVFSCLTRWGDPRSFEEKRRESCHPPPVVDNFHRGLDRRREKRDILEKRRGEGI